jgi:hypothetical protein|tara:strand:+ start:2063 stop:2746 length:684 start_codon:yes stop_codon:yes gene_type:complete
MKNKTSFKKLLEKLNRDLTSDQKTDAVERNIVLPEGEEYDIDSLMADVNQMKEDLEKGIFTPVNEVHDSNQDENDGLMLGMTDKSGNPIPAIHPSFNPPTDQGGKSWEKGNAKINEAMKVYNEQKKQSYKKEQEQDTFKRLMGYEIPEDKGRIKESRMWGLPKNQDRLVVIMDKEECVLVKKVDFDFNKLDEANQMSASKAGHSLNVFNQLFETWYEYSSADFEKLI